MSATQAADKTKDKNLNISREYIPYLPCFNKNPAGADSRQQSEEKSHE
jgi:hypothetical protein